MSDNKIYYYLKLKENFFDNDDMKLLESMDNGYLYSNILLKLYLKSLKSNGRLMFKEIIPYNTKMIATLTNHNIDIVEKAITIFKEFNLIEILNNGAIYLLDIENFIGKSSSEGDRKRKYRLKLETERKQLVKNKKGQMSDKRPPELELELDLELKKDIYSSEQKSSDGMDHSKNNISLDKDKFTKKKEIEKIKEKEFNQFWNEYDKKRGNKKKLFSKWCTLSKKDKELIFAYIPKYKIMQPNKKYRKDPSTFLNNNAWLDEIIMPEQYRDKYGNKTIEDTYVPQDLQELERKIKEQESRVQNSMGVMYMVEGGGHYIGVGGKPRAVKDRVLYTPEAEKYWRKQATLRYRNNYKGWEVWEE